MATATAPTPSERRGRPASLEEMGRFWDWLELRQSFLARTRRLSRAGTLSEDVPWLEDPLAARPLTARVRRALDVMASLALLTLVSPVLLLCMLLVKLTSRGPVVFVQRRIGYQCRVFNMYKLRTMVDGAERLESSLMDSVDGTFMKLRHDPRTTPLGRFLRKYSLDELPQLVNVLTGDMALVGPRPLLLSDFRKFPKQEQMRRFSVPPGITGLWQVSGRSSCSDEERILLDLEYVERCGLRLDLEILLRTIPVVLRTDGAV